MSTVGWLWDGAGSCVGPRVRAKVVQRRYGRGCIEGDGTGVVELEG